MKRVVLLLISICLSCGCLVKKVDNADILVCGITLTFGPSTEYHDIYEYEDGSKIISGYEMLGYTNCKTDNITYYLEDAIKTM